MARTGCSLSIDTTALADAIADLERIARELPKRHGDAFRGLDRRLTALLEGGASLSEPEVHDLGEGELMGGIPPELTAILAEARRLGVI